MFLGPVFNREAIAVPRRLRFYVARAAYVVALLVLISTAWQVLTGTQVIRNVGDLARFGALVFQILGPLQLVVCLFLAAITSALAVAQEKDRRTLVLLLLSKLSNWELVLGQVFASLLATSALLVGAAPFFMLSALLGGVAFAQVARVFAVTAVAMLVCASLGSTLAFWREKTYQTLAATALVLIFWTAGWEIAARGIFGPRLLGYRAPAVAASLSPWHAVLEAARPVPTTSVSRGWSHDTTLVFLLAAAGAAVLLNAIAIVRVRAWNSVAEVRPQRTQPDDEHAAPAEAAADSMGPTAHAAGGRQRNVWNNPILWREMRTWAYGRKVLAIRLGYAVLFAATAWAVIDLEMHSAVFDRTDAAWRLVPLFVLSLLLVNIQAVTSLTSERDIGALDLLLVTDISPKEFVYGKLLGVFYNAKEMILLPMALAGFLWFDRLLSLENLAYLLAGWLVMNVFAGVLGLHVAMTYANSRSAIGASLGTLFFLFIGIATCMRIMLAFSGSFAFQLQPFLASMLGGSVGLYLAIGARNPSPAITAASLICPLATLYALTSFLLGYTLAVFLVVAAAYGFTAAAMLIPAVDEFDLATGRTDAGEES